MGGVGEWEDMGVPRLDPKGKPCSSKPSTSPKTRLALRVKPWHPVPGRGTLRGYGSSERWLYYDSF